MSAEPTDVYAEEVDDYREDMIKNAERYGMPLLRCEDFLNDMVYEFDRVPPELSAFHALLWAYTATAAYWGRA